MIDHNKTLFLLALYIFEKTNMIILTEQNVLNYDVHVLLFSIQFQFHLSYIRLLHFWHPPSLNVILPILWIITYVYKIAVGPIDNCLKQRERKWPKRSYCSNLVFCSLQKFLPFIWNAKCIAISVESYIRLHIFVTKL